MEHGFLPEYRHPLFPLLHAVKGRLHNSVANPIPAFRWQGILFRINCDIRLEIRVDRPNITARDNAKRDLESLLDQRFFFFSLTREVY